MISKYIQHKLYAFAVLLLVIGGLNWGYVAFTGKDFISYILGKGAVTNAIFLVVGLAALCIAFYRDTYLPFLGPSVMPCSALTVSVPDKADTEVRVSVMPGAKVMYWAAEPANKDMKMVQDWRKAYLSFRNAGVAIADGDGYVTLKVRRPQGYLVPFKGELQPHIHYRVCENDGMMGRVMTVTLDGVEYFENEDDEEHREAVEAFANMEEEEEAAEAFANMEEEEEAAEAFANMEEEEEGFANMEEEEEAAEAFANEEEEEAEAFRNRGTQEEDEAVSGMGRPAFPAVNAMPELNKVAAMTAERSLMPQSGAPLEAPHPPGYDLKDAFAQVVPPSYTPIKYT